MPSNTSPIPAFKPEPDLPLNPERSLSRREAAAYLGISEPFLKQLDLSGQGPAAIRIGRRWTYLRADLDAFRLSRRTAPADAGQEAA